MASNICQGLPEFAGFLALGPHALLLFSLHAERRLALSPLGRGLHSFTFRLNVSASCGPGGAL